MNLNASMLELCEETKNELQHILQDTNRKLLIVEEHLNLDRTGESFSDSVWDLLLNPMIQLRRLDLQAKERILYILCKQHQIEISGDCLQQLAIKTASFTAGDLRSLVVLVHYISKARRISKPELEHFNEAIDEMKLSLKQGTHVIGERSTITWSDMGGVDSVRQAFGDILERFRKGDLKCQGIVLYGPPGCGKTMAAQAMANEGGFNFISIKPAELLNKYLGETERNIRKVFAEAKEYEPCMIYFDGWDGFSKTKACNGIKTSAIQTLLAEMDGFTERGKSIILASTNRLEDIDPAMTRLGRLSEKIHIGLPNKEARRDILSLITSRLSLMCVDDYDLIEYFAEQTENFTAADLTNLMSQAKKRALSEVGKSEIMEETVIHYGHLEWAFKNVKRYLDHKFE